MYKIAPISTISQSSIRCEPEFELIGVLHVVDDLSYRLLCECYLCKAPDINYRVSGAESIAIAMGICLLERYDCLIVDCSLPDANSSELMTSLYKKYGNVFPSALYGKLE